MSDLIYVGKDVQSFQTAPRYDGYDKVVLNLDDNNYISSPNVHVIDASKWDSRDDGEYEFTYRPSIDRWRTPFGTNANIAGLRVYYGLELYYAQFTSPKDGDAIVVIKSTVNGEVSVKAELNRAGNVLEANCPLVRPSDRQQVADNLLWNVYQFEYQPFNAKGAYITPAAEIGDGVTAYGIYAGLFEQETIFNRLMLSNIGSAISNEAEVEMDYEDASERKYMRKFAETAATLEIFADRISQSVTNADFQAAINTMADEINAKVSSSGGNSRSFSWSLTPNGFTLYSNGAQVFKCDSSGITVTGDGTFTGNVYAKNIQYGSSYGTMNGAAITPSTVHGGSNGQIAPYTVTGGYGGNVAQGAYGIAYANTSFTGTLDQVGVNANNINILSSRVASISAGYFNSISTSSILFQNYYFYVHDGYVRASLA